MLLCPSSSESQRGILSFASNRRRRNLRYGISVPNFGEYADIRAVAGMARNAEQAGWDGFFIWDHIGSEASFGGPLADPWIALTAIALATQRIRIGTMVTPVARRRPWKLARETASLDHLSSGRVVLGVGLGYPPEGEFGTFGEDTDDRVRAQKLDEGLDIMTGLWSGEPFKYDGKHHQVAETTFLPAALQSPRIPIWVACMWPNRGPLRRAARWDGVFPLDGSSGGARMLPPGDVREIVAHVRKHRQSDAPFDVVIGGETPDAGGSAIVQPYEEAGVTWWIEGINGWRGPFDEMRERVRQGPPSG